MGLSAANRSANPRMKKLLQIFLLQWFMMRCPDPAAKRLMNIANNIRFLKYGDKNVIIFKVKGLTSAAIHGDDYYERKGADLEKIPARRIPDLLNRFR